MTNNCQHKELSLVPGTDLVKCSDCGAPLDVIELRDMRAKLMSDVELVIGGLVALKDYYMNTESVTDREFIVKVCVSIELARRALLGGLPQGGEEQAHDPAPGR